MKNSKLLTVLESLNKEEWTDLKKHILSRTKPDSDICHLFLFFHQQKHALGKLTNTEKIIADHFPNLSTKTVLNYMSTLYQWMEEWLVNTEIKKNSYQFDLLLLHVYNNRGLYNLANQVHHRLENQIQSDKQWHLSKTQTLATLYQQQYYSNNPIKYEQGPNLLTKVINTYGQFIKEQSLYFEIELFNWGRIQRHDYSAEIQLLHAITEQLPQSDYADHLALLRATIMNDDITAFGQLCEALLRNQIKQHTQDITVINLYLIQKANYFWQTGKILPEYKKIIVQLYEFAMQNDIYVEHGKLPPVTMRNIIVALSATQSYDYVNDFIQQWKQKVNTSYTESFEKILTSINCLYHEKYEVIPTLLRSVEFHDIIEKIHVLTMLTISTFINRKNDYNLFVTTYDNFNSLLKRNRNKISEKYFKSIYNLMDFIKKLDNRRHAQSIPIDHYDYLFYRNWCIKMLEKENDI